MKPKASVGRAVHYVDMGGQHCAAIINAAGHNGADPLSLTVFRPWPAAGLEVHATVARYSETHEPYTWHWPEREPE